MKKIILILLFVPIIIYSQIDISAGMGINLSSRSSVKDYININFAGASNQVKSFETEAEFFGELDYSVKNNFDIGLEYAISIYSYTDASFLSVYDFSYLQHKPSLMGYYVYKGEGYKFKFGGGGGVRYVSLTEKLPTTSVEKVYTALGYGFVAKAFGMTTLGDNLYAYIGVDARLDFPGEVESEGVALYNRGLGENVTLNSVSAGIKLGIVYSL